MIDNREVRVYERTTEQSETVWRENSELRQTVDVSGADSLITACINVMTNALYRTTHSDAAMEVEALKVTASYWINLPNGGSAGAKVEVFQEIHERN